MALYQQASDIESAVINRRHLLTLHDLKTMISMRVSKMSQPKLV